MSSAFPSFMWNYFNSIRHLVRNLVNYLKVFPLHIGRSVKILLSWLVWVLRVVLQFTAEFEVESYWQQWDLFPQNMVRTEDLCLGRYFKIQFGEVCGVLLYVNILCKNFRWRKSTTHFLLMLRECCNGQRVCSMFWKCVCGG